MCESSGLKNISYYVIEIILLKAKNIQFFPFEKTPKILQILLSTILFKNIWIKNIPIMSKHIPHEYTDL